MVNASGQIVSQSRYLPFGELLWEDGTSPTDYTYTGQRSLSDIGLMDYNARFYDPMLGRFTSPDSVIAVLDQIYDWDRYSYVRNNPLNAKDPSGHIACTVVDGDNYQGNCEEDINTLLFILVSEGGETGRELVMTLAFRENEIANAIEGPVNFIVTDNPADGYMYYNGEERTFTLPSSVLNEMHDNPELAKIYAGALGHEIRHLQQTLLIQPSKLAEVDAYNIQDKLYEEMGIESGPGQHWLVNQADKYGNLVGESYSKINNAFQNTPYESYPWTKMAPFITGPLAKFSEKYQKSQEKYYETMGRLYRRLGEDLY